ncbi:MAG TPA: right-handed parallel beta-helix repeat-containing protein [Fimbriimonas sp.]|nr:right-handed parallel beta-helix repeat-containing protein [Fimbriimonas sp.]
MLLSAIAFGLDNVVHVNSREQLIAAAQKAIPGTTILVAPGEYRGGIHLVNVTGTRHSPIVIAGSDRANPPVFVGGGSTLQVSDATYLELRDMVFRGATGNGLNIDDGGTPETPSHHITLRDLRVSDLPEGNNDGIKLSGLEDFKVENCIVERWGGSAVDMVGCRRGYISENKFLNGGDSGVQMKGGTAQVVVRKCEFKNYGQRAVNIGGSTGREFFRPPLNTIKEGERYEARQITVEGCTFVGGVAPIAFVGVDGAVVRFNTIYHPQRWAIRILQETASADFLRCRNGVFESNLVVFRSDQWFSGGVNIGGGTLPQTFQFAKNFWFCSDRPDRSKPSLPTTETGGVYGQDPLLIDPTKGDLGVKPGSPAAKIGAHGL